MVLLVVDVAECSDELNGLGRVGATLTTKTKLFITLLLVLRLEVVKPGFFSLQRFREFLMVFLIRLRGNSEFQNPTVLMNAHPGY